MGLFFFLGRGDVLFGDFDFQKSEGLGEMECFLGRKGREI